MCSDQNQIAQSFSVLWLEIDGVQITGMAVVTIVFLALGFILPASIGMLLAGMILLYLFPGIVVGYVAKYLWRTIEGASQKNGGLLISWCKIFIKTIVITVPNSLENSKTPNDTQDFP
ncbi:hypothetical protein Peur_069593 [Populus x canadensis]|jgi:transmembrane 9 superfamily protein 2/4